MPLAPPRREGRPHGLAVTPSSHGGRGARLHPPFADHVARRSADGFRLNVNVLGEAILSDAEADERLRLVRQRILRPDVTYVSLKISAVVANLDVLAFDHSASKPISFLVNGKLKFLGQVVMAKALLGA